MHKEIEFSSYKEAVAFAKTLGGKFIKTPESLIKDLASNEFEGRLYKSFHRYLLRYRNKRD